MGLMELACKHQGNEVFSAQSPIVHTFCCMFVWFLFLFFVFTLFFLSSCQKPPIICTKIEYFWHAENSNNFHRIGDMWRHATIKRFLSMIKNFPLVIVHWHRATLQRLVENFFFFFFSFAMEPLFRD